MTSRLFDGRPLDITLHVLRYLNPRDVIILRRVNRAHYSLFTSEVICRTALRIFFGEPWHSSSRPDEANVQAEGCTPQTRLLFDQVCRRRDNQRRGNFTRFYKLEPPFKSHSRAQCFGTDALGNAVLLIGSKQRSVAEQWGSFMVYWLEGDDTQRETVLHVYVDFENKLVRVLAERITITQPQNASQSAQSQGERNACNLEHLSTDMTATPTDVLIARHGKIAVCASQHYIKPTILAVLDLAELRNRSVPSSAENLDSFPLQYVWEPQELFLKGLGHRSVKLESYVPPIWQLDSAHMQPLDVNAHYVVYKNLGWFQSPDPSSRDLLASEQVVVLPLLDSIATLQQAQIHNLGPWGSHVQQLPGVSWTKTSKVPRGSALTAACSVQFTAFTWSSISPAHDDCQYPAVWDALPLKHATQ
ncbi:hypothetical protein BDZ91DRAFT_413740 [Kalaharituber pfeilii]|nr:hypothetical protein BDZ91DRAFT_413740 [Kalaharituber pfeilii]